MALPPQVPRRRQRPGFPPRRTVVRVVVTVRRFVPAPRRRPSRVLPPRRGRVVQVTVGAFAGPPVWRPPIVRRRVPFLPTRRGRTPSVPLTQAVTVVVPPYVPPIVRRSLRGFTRRGRVVQVPLTQTATVTVSFIPAIQGRRRGAVAPRRRSQPVTPVTVTVVVPTVPQRHRAAVWSRRRSPVTTPPPVVVVVVWVPAIGNRRRLWLQPSRRQRLETVIAVIIPPPPPPPPPVPVPRLTLIQSEDSRRSAGGQVVVPLRPTQRRFPH